MKNHSPAVLLVIVVGVGGCAPVPYVVPRYTNPCCTGAPLVVPQWDQNYLRREMLILEPAEVKVTLADRVTQTEKDISQLKKQTGTILDRTRRTDAKLDNLIKLIQKLPKASP